MRWVFGCPFVGEQKWTSSIVEAGVTFLPILPSSSSTIDNLCRVTAESRRKYASLRRRLLIVPHIPKYGSDSPNLVMDNPLSQNPEYSKVASQVAIGFVVLGFVGFFVKLIFIPINNIIVGSI